MSKNIKNYASLFIIIILSVVLGFTAYAEDDDTSTTSDQPVACTMDAKVCPDGSSVGRVGPNCEFAKCPGEGKNPLGRPLLKPEIRDRMQEVNDDRKENREENQANRKEMLDELKQKKDEIKTFREEHKAQIEEVLQSVKDKREAFKTELEAKREEIKTKREEMRAKFQEELAKIKDEKKKLSAEKIVSIIEELNTKATNNLSGRVEKIENVLVSVESRISKGEENGLDVTQAKAEAEKAKQAIEDARSAIATQASKVYEVNITDEASLRAEMKRLRDLFTSDIKAVNELVKKAHEAVRITATTLAKIPKINEESTVDATVDTSTEDTSNTN